MTSVLQYAAPAAFAGAFFGCLITLHLSAFGVVPEIASALVTTLLGGQFLIARSTVFPTRDFVPAVYGGAFGGMTSVLWLSGIGSDHPVVWVVASFMSLSTVCGLAFGGMAVFDAYAGRRLTHGFGGRSGAIATVACVFFVQLAALCGADDSLFHAARADLDDVNLSSLAPLVAACLIGTAVTLLVMRRERVAGADLADKTFVASAVALIGLLAVHQISPTDARLLEAYYAGCFLGMSSRERLNGWIETVLGAVVLASLIIQVRIFLPGIGGGLGLAAFVTVAILVALKQITCFVLPINRSKNMPDLLPIVRSRSGHPSPNPPFEKQGSSWSEISLRPSAVVASLAAATVLIGGLIWPAQFASKKTIAVATAAVSARDQATPNPVAPQAEMRTGAIDAAPPAAGAVAAEVSPGSMPAGENTPSEKTSSEKTSSEKTSSETPTDISAASAAGLKFSSAAVDEQAAAFDQPKIAEPTTAPPGTSEVIAAHEPALVETQKDEDGVASDTLFREYLRWRAARVSAVTPSARQNAATSQHHLRTPAGIPTPAATNSHPRPARPASAPQATPITSPVPHPRRPHLGDTETHAAIGPVAPESASPPSF
jgi:hypothetical protein